MLEEKKKKKNGIKYVLCNRLCYMDMEQYVIFRNNKRVSLREEDMTAEKLSNIFQVKLLPASYNIKSDAPGCQDQLYCPTKWKIWFGHSPMLQP